MKSPYQVLGVSPDAPDYVIQAAYRACLKRFHPDKYQGDDAKERTDEIIQAYEFLKRADRKDKFGQSHVQPAPTPATANPDKIRTAGEIEKSLVGYIIGIVICCLIVWVVLSQYQDVKDERSSIFAVDENSNLDGSNLTPEVDLFATKSDVIEADIDIDALGIDPSMFAAPPSLPAIAEPVDFVNIENAVATFNVTLRKSGITGVRKYSENCHKAARIEPTWKKMDFCAAFDFAAAAMDHSVSREIGVSPNPYFAFQAQNQSDYYQRPATTFSRIPKIRDAAQGVLRRTSGVGPGSQQDLVNDMAKALDKAAPTRGSITETQSSTATINPERSSPDTSGTTSARQEIVDRESD